MSVLEIEDDLDLDLDVTSTRVLNPFLIETFMLLVSKQCLGMRQRDDVCIQFSFEGDVRGACYFYMNNGEIYPVKGRADRPDLHVSDLT